MGKDLSVYKNVIDSPTNLVMSGVESDTYWDLAVGAGFDRLLVSFHYIQKKGKRWLKERMEKHPNVKLMIDSGAYTFHVNEEEYKKKPVSFFEDYVRKYTAWIRDNKDIIFSCVEVDIANLVGFDKVEEFRRDYFEPLKDEGVLVCYVWHEFDGKPHWEEMCQRFDYVGFSLGTGSLSESELMKMMNTARRYGAIVHGFALTRVELMSKLPFFTGDSTTWLVGTQYGELNWFDGRRMRRLKKKDWKTVYRQKYIKLGANAKLMAEENPYELIRINALVFKQAELYIRKRIKAKMYWFAKKGSVDKPMAKKLIGRKKPIEAENTVTSEESPKPKVKPKKIIKKKKVASKVVHADDSTTSVHTTTKEGTTNRSTSDLDVGKGTKGIWDTFTQTSPSGESEAVNDRPKTKFELFQEESEPKKKEIYELDEQIGRLPNLSWLEGDTSNWKQVADGIRFNIEGITEDDFLDIVYNFCLFLRDTDKLEEQEDEEIFEVVDIVLSKQVDDREKAIELLTDYYAKNLTGEREDFKEDNSGMSDEAPPRPNERASYLEDVDYEYVDVSIDEMKNYLPEPQKDGVMPEVDQLDQELATNGIVAVRDDKGRFLKGQRKVRKPKQVWSEHFPKLACNTCYKAGECPEYQPDMACAYDKVFKKFKTRNMDDVMDGMIGMADLNMERMTRLAFFESMDGGMPDPTLTSMVDQNMNLMQKIMQLHQQKASIVATQRKTLHADGTEETITSVNNPGNGILSQIFGGSSKSDNRDDIIDAEMSDVD